MKPCVEDGPPGGGGDQYRGLSTALRFGRDDGVVVEKQIPSLRCGMTARKAKAKAKAKATATATAKTTTGVSGEWRGGLKWEGEGIRGGTFGRFTGGGVGLGTYT
jgi:hypothetical protein